MEDTITKVLAVDDEPTVLDILYEVLSSDGYQVTKAVCAEKGLEAMQHQNFHAVIADIRLQGMSGLGMLKQVKAHQPSTEVVIITSFSSLQTAIEALREGAYDYLIKPFEELDVITTVVTRATEKSKLNYQNESLLNELKNSNQQLVQANKELSEKSIRDGLTGLYNYRHFKEALETEILRSKRHQREFSLLYLDIDHFKHYNDNNGHPAGDKVLVQLAEIMQKRLRRSDIIARLGGEEFAILMPETPATGAHQVGEDIRSLVQEYAFSGREQQPGGQLTVSLGLATFSKDDMSYNMSSTELKNHVDEALYRAKQQGRNTLVVAD